MNTLTSPEALKLLNQRLRRPITRQAFNRHLLPVLAAAGYARTFGPRQPAIIDGDAWRGWWIGYLAMREQRIIAGEWGAKRAYSAEEAELYRDGAYDEAPA